MYTNTFINRFYQGSKVKFLFMNKLNKIPCSRVHERFMNGSNFSRSFFLFFEHGHEQEEVFTNSS
jgi:hypothetical protein